MITEKKQKFSLTHSEWGSLIHTDNFSHTTENNLKVCTNKSLSLLVLVYIFMIVFCSIAIAVPKAVINPQTNSFGSVVEGTVVESTFLVSNAGDEPLVIQRGTAPCGCTVVGISQPLTIAPGSSSEVKISFDTSGRSGKQEKAATLYCNDPDQSSIDLSLVGTVEAIAQFSPQRITFNNLGINEKATAGLKISPQKGYSISEVKTYSSKVSVEKTNEGTYLVSLAPTTVGEVRDRVVIYLRNESGDEVTAQVPVYARVVSGVTFKPSVVSFGVIDGNLPLTKTVRIENKEKGKKLSIISLTSTASFINVSSEEKKSGTVFEIVVTVDPKGKFNEELKASVTAILSDGKEIVLPVLGIRPPKEEA